MTSWAVLEIDAIMLRLRAIESATAAAILAGRLPSRIIFAPGYPSRFSLEVMRLVVDQGGPGIGGPFFMVRKRDHAIVGEIGCTIDPVHGSGQVGYSVVEPSWGHGYATDALTTLVWHLLTQTPVRRITAETPEDHVASRRVMEKAGMRLCDRYAGEVDGQERMLVRYEIRADPASVRQATAPARR